MKSLKTLSEQRKIKGISWNDLANGLPVSGEGLRIAFSRGKVQSVYIPIIESNLNNINEEPIISSEPNIDYNQDFYEWLKEIKILKNLNFEDLGKPISKNGNAMRMAIIRESLKEIEKEMIINWFSNKTKKQISPVEDVRFEKIISKEVSGDLKPILLELQQGQTKTHNDNQEIFNLIQKLSLRLDEMQAELNQLQEKIK